MVKIENVDVNGWEAAIRGMRNPLNSWEKSDSEWKMEYDETGTSDWFFRIGHADRALMMQLVRAGSDHSKFMRLINVTADITAPLYWWKEFDAYKVGTVRNSCSTMHKIHAKEFELSDFSYEHLSDSSLAIFEKLVDELNFWRNEHDHGVNKGDKYFWWQMIQLLPSSYNQRATVQMNYAVLRNMYHARKNHKLDEWHTFCDWVQTLPESELITEGA